MPPGDATTRSVFAVSLEVLPAGSRMRFVRTERAAFLGGHDGTGGRERGTSALLTRLERTLQRETARK